MCRLCYITKEQERRDYLVFIGTLFILPRASKHHSHAPGSDVARDRDPVRQRPLLLPLRDVAMVSWSGERDAANFKDELPFLSIWLFMLFVWWLKCYNIYSRNIVHLSSVLGEVFKAIFKAKHDIIVRKSLYVELRLRDLGYQSAEITQLSDYRQVPIHSWVIDMSAGRSEYNSYKISSLKLVLEVPRLVCMPRYVKLDICEMDGLEVPTCCLTLYCRNSSSTKTKTEAETEIN